MPRLVLFRSLQELYDFVDDNPMVDMVDVAYTNNPHIIASQHKMTAINSAIEVRATYRSTYFAYRRRNIPVRGRPW